MIVTLTANPSLDRTIELSTALTRGAVQRATSVRTEPGGKGVNVARVITAAGGIAVAVLPSAESDPICLALRAAQVAYRAAPAAAPVRINITITEPDGTTTKVNEPGGDLAPATRDSLLAQLEREAGAAKWAVLCGSLPPGVPTDWYATLVLALRPLGCRIAIDTSEGPLRALFDGPATSLPDLIKPNAEELAEVTGSDPEKIEADPDVAVAACRALLDRGVGRVLATLGSRGAVLVSPEGAWLATPPRIVARSTVGAGDAALSGYLLADVAGLDPAECLRHAVAYGAAAAALPGSQVPTPADLRLDEVVVTDLTPELADHPMRIGAGDISEGARHA